MPPNSLSIYQFVRNNVFVQLGILTRRVYDVCISLDMSVFNAVLFLWLCHIAYELIPSTHMETKFRKYHQNVHNYFLVPEILAILMQFLSQYCSQNVSLKLMWELILCAGMSPNFEFTAMLFWILNQSKHGSCGFGLCQARAKHGRPQSGKTHVFIWFWPKFWTLKMSLLPQKMVKNGQTSESREKKRT